MINEEVKRIVEYAKKTNDVSITEDRAFSFLVIQYFFYNGFPIEECYSDIADEITDARY